MLYVLRQGAKKRGIPVEITKEEFSAWFDQGEIRCAYCSITEEDSVRWQEHRSKQKDKKWQWRITVDRKDNTLGYSLNNLVFACWDCNRLKNNLLTFDEMRIIGQQVIKPKWQNALAVIPL